jgi:putative flippase GtrA
MWSSRLSVSTVNAEYRLPRAMPNREILRQILIFGLVGAASTITHYLVALATHEGLGLHLYTANLAGYACAVAVSYFGHGLLTFRVKLSRQVLRRFIIVSISSFLASEAILAGCETLLQLSHRVSLAVVVLSIPAISFLFNKLWVYRTVHSSQ